MSKRRVVRSKFGKVSGGLQEEEGFCDQHVLYVKIKYNVKLEIEGWVAFELVIFDSYLYLTSYL